MFYRHSKLSSKSYFICIDECDTVPAAANGEFKLETDGVITTAALTCDEGYKVKGSGAVSCEIDGTWNIVGEQTCSESSYPFYKSILLR